MNDLKHSVVVSDLVFHHIFKPLNALAHGMRLRYLCQLRHQLQIKLSVIHFYIFFCE
jgi:hypothetical protein